MSRRVGRISVVGGRVGSLHGRCGLRNGRYIMRDGAQSLLLFGDQYAPPVDVIANHSSPLAADALNILATLSGVAWSPCWGCCVQCDSDDTFKCGGVDVYTMKWIEVKASKFACVNNGNVTRAGIAGTNRRRQPRLVLVQPSCRYCRCYCCDYP